MWVLAALVPIALALSHPAVFVAGGIIVVLVPAVVKIRQRNVWIAFVTLALVTAGTFLILYATFTRSQADATLATMQAQWGAAFPPLDDPVALARWFATVHTGSMFAYPCGGECGGSSLTFLLFLVGTVVLWKRGMRVILLTCLAQFGIALLAAAMAALPLRRGGRRLPPRGSCNTSCRVSASSWASAPQFYLKKSASAVFACGSSGSVSSAFLAAGVVPLIADAVRPYRSVHAHRARASSPANSGRISPAMPSRSACDGTSDWVSGSRAT